MSETKVETLSGIAERDRRIAALPDEAANAVSGWLHHHGLSKARIIRGQCRTCRGSGLRQDLPYEGDPRCPACHGEQPPPWIVMLEAWEAFVCAIQGASSKQAILSAPDGETKWRIFELRARLSAAALLGGRAEMADEVVEPVSYACIWTGTEKADHVWANPGDIVYIERRESEERDE